METSLVVHCLPQSARLFIFNRATRPLSYQLHQLSMDFVTQKALLLEICYAIKRFLSPIICLTSTGKGWPTLCVQRSPWHKWSWISFWQAQTSPLTLHAGLSSMWWCTWKNKVRNAWIVLIHVTVPACATVLGKMPLSQLSQSCSVTWLGHFELK